MTIGLRFIEKDMPVRDKPGFMQRAKVLQQHHGNLGWIDVPFVEEPNTTNKSDIT